MNARGEIDSWLEQNRQIKDESERKIFFQKMREQLSSKSPEEQKENLIALKEAVDDFEMRVDTAINNPEIKVYPSSCEERELLKSLFSKMNIRFELG